MNDASHAEQQINETEMRVPDARVASLLQRVATIKQRLQTLGRTHEINVSPSPKRPPYVPWDASYYPAQKDASGARYALVLGKEPKTGQTVNLQIYFDSHPMPPVPPDTPSWQEPQPNPERLTQEIVLTKKPDNTWRLRGTIESKGRKDTFHSTEAPLSRAEYLLKGYLKALG
jgi:hypothetical protein